MTDNHQTVPSIWDNPPVDKASLFIHHMIDRGLLNPIFDALTNTARHHPGETFSTTLPNDTILTIRINPDFSTIVTWMYNNRPISPTKAKFLLRPSRDCQTDWNVEGKRIADEVDRIMYSRDSVSPLNDLGLTEASMKDYEAICEDSDEKIGNQ